MYKLAKNMKLEANAAKYVKTCGKLGTMRSKTDLQPAAIYLFVGHEKIGYEGGLRHAGCHGKGRRKKQRPRLTKQLNGDWVPVCLKTCGETCEKTFASTSLLIHEKVSLD